MTPDEPTDEMPGGPEDPTEVNSPGDEPTEVNPPGNEPTEVNPRGDHASQVIPPGSGPAAAPEPGEQAGPGGPARRGQRGIGVLIGSIVASLVLVGAYALAGGPVAPDGPADPCDARPWTDPQNLEEAAQQFALSAADGAACELGVSREELTRSIADDQARQDFMDEHGFGESDLEDALRSGLNRAVDDAENAGAISGITPALLRAAIKVMPMDTMIGLLENADSIFNGDFGSMGGLGDALNAITGGLDGLGNSGDPGNSNDPLGSLGDALEGALPEGTTDDLNQIIPEEERQKLEDQAREKLKQGLEDFLGP